MTYRCSFALLLVFTAAAGHADDVDDALRAIQAAGEAHRVVGHVLHELEDERLVELDGGPMPGRNGASCGPTAGAGSGALPRLRKYTDMQDLLLLDPIHEIDQSGWPNSANPG